MNPSRYSNFSIKRLNSKVWIETCKRWRKRLLIFALIWSPTNNLNFISNTLKRNTKKIHYPVELLAEQFHLIHDALFRQVVEEILIPISSMCSSIYTAQNQIFVLNNTTRQNQLQIFHNLLFWCSCYIFQMFKTACFVYVMINFNQNTRALTLNSNRKTIFIKNRLS